MGNRKKFAWVELFKANRVYPTYSTIECYDQFNYKIFFIIDMRRNLSLLMVADNAKVNNQFIELRFFLFLKPYQ